MAGKKGPVKERFEKKFSKTDGCWIWTASREKFGYGLFRGNAVHNRCFKAHRMSWELYIGPIPEGMCVLHRCDNPPCVNPSHLFLGTKKDNTRDMISKNRHSFYLSVRNKK